MMKKVALLSLLVLLPACDWFAKGAKTIQGSGNPIRQERQVESFDELAVYGVGKVVLVQGEQESLTIEADENIIQLIDSQVKDDKLFIKPHEGLNLRSKSKIIYTVTCKELKELKLSGSIDMHADALTTKKLDAKLSGTSRIKAAVQLESLKVKSAGSAKLYLEGSTVKQKVQAAGSIHYDAGNLESARAKIEASGASRVTVAVSQKLEVDASGVSIVNYLGNPEVVVSTSGAATVQKVG